ncbi:MAG TPA: M20/M25/M40 family metallo-hydrolase, partial [Opitutaceae bacterium]
MRVSAPILLAAALALPAAWADAQAQETALGRDPDIQEMVASISQERIQKTIFVLASFKTRLTISDPLPSGDGIGGAAAWIRAEFERISKENGGRLKVDLDTFDQPMAPPRIPRPIQITNVVATLPGTDTDSGRTLVVSGHYDSRASDMLDETAAAPGADDDASGVSAVIELARVMSHYRFRATIVFIAVAGEEQGLNGSSQWAREAKKRSANIEAMFDNDIIGSSRSEKG